MWRTQLRKDISFEDQIINSFNSFMLQDHDFATSYNFILCSSHVKERVTNHGKLIADDAIILSPNDERFLLYLY